MYPSHKQPRIPDRLVVLSILPPPSPDSPPAPFGFGSLTVTAGSPPGEAAFARHAHGYGAGYPAQRMRADLRRLLQPEDTVLLHLPLSASEGRGHRHMVRALALQNWLPRTASRRISVIPVFGHILEHAASLARVTIPAEPTTPLARLHRIDAQAQAAWVHWLWSHCAPRLRSRLLASFLAWQVTERVARKV